jgi:hypothetical protein
MRSAGSGRRRSARVVRGAIYTRKSSEERLDQEFNSLQAQREACEAFINSQRHEGWVCLPAACDDGGFSGGQWIGRLCNGCSPISRKSSEEGLEQEFNLLQAQREACEAFINSQRHEGWVCLPAACDDGGFSGGQWIGRLCNCCSPISPRVGSRSSSTRSTG